MPITEAQREKRRGYLGSSDSPSIMGVNVVTGRDGEIKVLGTPHDVFLSKVYELADIKTSEPLEVGNEFEEPLLRWAAKELGVEIEHNVSVVCAANPVFAANLDGRIVGKPHGVEAKTGNGDEYGEEGTDQVPNRVIVQTHHQMLVDDLEVVFVPALVAVWGRLRRCIYRVERNERLIGAIREEGSRFWTEHVIPRVPPADFMPSLDTVKRIQRIDGEVVDLDPALVEAWETAKAEEKAAKEARDKAQARMLAALGDAEAGDYGDPRKLVTYREQGRSGIDGRGLRMAHPAISEEFTTESRFRVARIQKR